MRKNLYKLVVTAILSAVAVVGNAQTWVRDGIGRNMEFVQQGGAASRNARFDVAAYGKVWIDATPWSFHANDLIEAVVAIRPGTLTPPPPSQREYWIHTALTSNDAKWNTLAQTIQLGSVLHEEQLPWQTVEGYAQFRVQWAIPETIESKWLTVAEFQPNTTQLGYSKIVQGTSSLYAEDFFTTSANQGNSDGFPHANIGLAVVPEPASIAMLGLGIFGLICRRRSAR